MGDKSVTKGREILSGSTPVGQILFDNPPSTHSRRVPGADRLITARIAAVASHFTADRIDRSTKRRGYRTITSSTTHLLLNEITFGVINVFESLSHGNTH